MNQEKKKLLDLIHEEIIESYKLKFAPSEMGTDIVTL